MATPDLTGDDGQAPQPKSRPHHPVVVAKQAQRAADLQLRIADRITTFAGSMQFVYIHVALFAIWMLFIESRPWPMLTRQIHTLTTELHHRLLDQPARDG
ncbi:MAG: hypothetical protein QOJ73_5930 [Streptosporangiaceae bacterium]|nr:hypothetical protein [Streptosporangiaceae bacterium]